MLFEMRVFNIFKICTKIFLKKAFWVGLFVSLPNVVANSMWSNYMIENKRVCSCSIINSKPM